MAVYRRRTWPPDNGPDTWTVEEQSLDIRASLPDGWELITEPTEYPEIAICSRHGEVRLIIGDDQRPHCPQCLTDRDR
ncbi:MAG: hypothetical protein GEV03_15225 [Streptosporangiales bacterium]|nr:hypothetical protein [Streptosporangiales bacterium]